MTVFQGTAAPVVAGAVVIAGSLPERFGTVYAAAAAAAAAPGVLQAKALAGLAVVVSENVGGVLSALGTAQTRGSSGFFPLGANTYPAGQPFQFAWVALPTGVTTSSIPLMPTYNQLAGEMQEAGWTVAVSGTFGAAGSVQVEYSGDGLGVPDSLSNWVSPSTWTFTSAGGAWLQTNFKKLRVVITGGDSTTNINVKVF